MGTRLDLVLAAPDSGLHGQSALASFPQLQTAMTFPCPFPVCSYSSLWLWFSSMRREAFLFPLWMFFSQKICSFERVTERHRDKEKEVSSIHWFTLQMAAMIQTEARARTFTQVSHMGLKRPIFPSIPRPLTGSWMANGAAGMWHLDVSATGRGFPCYVKNTATSSLNFELKEPFNCCWWDVHEHL